MKFCAELSRRQLFIRRVRAWILRNLWSKTSRDTFFSRRVILNCSETFALPWSVMLQQQSSSSPGNKVLRKNFVNFQRFEQIALELFSPSKYLNQFSRVIIINFLSPRVRSVAVEQTSNYWIKMPHFPCNFPPGFIEFFESAKTFNDPNIKYWNNSEITLSEI